MNAQTKTYFERDNFTSRRTTGHNAYDPESLLTGTEEQAGLTYQDPRVWESEEWYDKAVRAELTPEEIMAHGPRVRRNKARVMEALTNSYESALDKGREFAHDCNCGSCAMLEKIQFEVKEARRFSEYD